MIDSLEVVRKWLLSSTEVTALCGINVFAPELPPTYNPRNGNVAVTILVKGGPGGHEEISALQNVEVQIKCWADVNQGPLARQLYMAVFDTMQGKNAVIVDGVKATIISSLEMAAGSDLTDPDFGWQTVIGSFRLMITDTSAVVETPTDNIILLEDGSFLLLEDGSSALLEQ